jgi:hypothetical protein
MANQIIDFNSIPNDPLSFHKTEIPIGYKYIGGDSKIDLIYAYNGIEPIDHQLIWEYAIYQHEETKDIIMLVSDPVFERISELNCFTNNKQRYCYYLADILIQQKAGNRFENHWGDAENEGYDKFLMDLIAILQLTK